MRYVEYKQGQKHAGIDADVSDDISAFQDAGMMLSDTDVVVDIDEVPEKTIKAMIETFDIKTGTVWTDRGVHLYFRKPTDDFKKVASGVCNLGFKIEQHNKRSKPNGMTVRRNGVTRKMENIDIRQPLPTILHIPSKNKQPGTETGLLGMNNGDGRNQALFKHTCYVLSKFKDVSKVVNFINDYVFADPLSKEEIDNILKNASVDIESQDEKYFVADTIMHDYNVRKAVGEIWWMENGRYVKGIDEFRKLVYGRCAGKDTKYVDEIIRQINYRAKSEDGNDGYPIRVKNGYIADGMFIPCKNTVEFTPYTIDVEYDENCPPVPIVDEYIDNLTANDPEYRKLLLEALGYVMITNPERVRMFSKFFFFRGDGANGKGTLLQIMKKIYGDENCTALSIKQLVDPRCCVTMIGKLANLGDDIEPSTIDDDQLKVIKNITTADTITMRHMYQESFEANLTTKLYFTTNADLKTFEKGYAYKRRVLWLPMFNKVEKPDPKFIYKCTTPEALKYWIKLITEGYIRLYENLEWTKSKRVDEYNEIYHAENNPTRDFANSLAVDDVLGKSMTEAKIAFSEWAGDDSVKFSSKEFKETAKNKWNVSLKVKFVGGKSKRVFSF